MIKLKIIVGMLRDTTTKLFKRYSSQSSKSSTIQHNMRCLFSFRKTQRTEPVFHKLLFFASLILSFKLLNGSGLREAPIASYNGHSRLTHRMTRLSSP